MKRLPPPPKGGYDVPKDTPVRKTGKEFVSGDGTDHAMHDYILGKDDQFVTTIPYKAPR